MRTSRLAVALAVAGVVSVAGMAGYRFNHASANPISAQPAAAERPVRGLPDFSGLVEQNGPTVVNISVTQQKKTAFALPPSGEDDSLSAFLRRFQAPNPNGGMPVRGQGSGFIVSADGVILTNAHVVDGATEVNVKLADRREFRAKVIGKDARSDVAVLMIDAKNLPAVRLGDPRSLRPGEWVVAIGAPFGFENSVTAGIVSAKGRSLPDETYVPFIQTDVAVNPGNSGGPLFNLAGEVVGINSQILSQTGGYQGLSFAIPIDIAMKVKDQLLAQGHVTRGYVGVTVQPLSAWLADSFGLKKPEGALVNSVVPGSPAAKAGLKAGDVILRVDGSTIASSSDLPARVAAMKPGFRTQLDVWRNNGSQRITVWVGELETDAQMADAGSPATPEGKLGVAVRPLSAQEQSSTGVKGGLVVEQAGGAAARAGVQRGDVILALNGTPLRDAAQLRGLIAGSGRHVALLVQRGDTQVFIPVTLG